MRETIRIHHEFEGGIEKSVSRITDWYHEACRFLVFLRVAVLHRFYCILRSSHIVIVLFIPEERVQEGKSVNTGDDGIALEKQNSSIDLLTS